MKAVSKVVVAVLVVVAIVSLPVVLLLVAPMIYAGPIERLIRDNAGIDAEFADLEAGLFPPRIAAVDLVLRNPDPAFPEPLLVAERLSVGVYPARLLGDGPWWRASGVGVDVRVEQNARGRTNWDVGDDEEEDNGVLEGMALVDVARLTVLYITPQQAQQPAQQPAQQQEPQQHRFAAARLRLRQDAEQRMSFRVAGSYEDQPVDASGFVDLPGAATERELAVRVRLRGGSARIAAAIGPQGFVPERARFRADFTDLSSLGTLLQHDLGGFEPVALSGQIATPEPGRWRLDAEGQLAGQPLLVDGAVTLGDERYRLHRLALRYGDSAFEAAGEMAMAEQRLQGWARSSNLHVEQLQRLANLLAETAGELAAADDPEAMQPAEMIEAWRVDVALTVERLTYQQTELSGLEFEFVDREDGLAFAGSLESLRTGIRDAEDDLWQLVEPLQVQGRLTAADRPGAAPVEIAGRFSGADVAGAFTVLPGEPSFAVQARITSTRAVVAPAGVDLEAFEPLNVAGKLDRPASGEWQLTADGELGGEALQLAMDLRMDSERFRLRELDLRYGDTVLSAAGELALEEQRVEGRARGNMVRVEPVLDILAAVAALIPDEDNAQRSALQPVDVVEHWHVDVDVAVQELVYRETRLRGLELELRDGDAGLGFAVRLDALRTGTEGDQWQLREPLQIDARVTAKSARVTAKSARVTAKSGRVTPNAGRDAPRFGVEARFATAGIDGEVSVPPSPQGEMRFTLQADVTSTRALQGPTEVDLGELEPVDLSLRLAAPEPGRWEIIADGQLAGQPLDLVGALAVEDERYRLRQLDLNYGDTSLGATGELAVEEQRLQVRARAGSVQLDQLQRVADVIMTVLDDDEPAEVEPIDVVAHWSVDVAVAVDRLFYQDFAVHGLVVEASDREDAIDFSLSLDHLRGGNDEAVSQLLEPLRAQGSFIAAEARDGRALGVEVRFATSDVDGEIMLRPAPERDPNLLVRVTAGPDAPVQGPWADALLPLDLHVEADLDDGVWRVEPLQLVAGDSGIDGWLLVDTTAEPVLVRGELHSQQIDLMPVLVAMGGDEAPPEEAREARDEDRDEARDEDRMLIPDDPIDWSWLAAASVDLAARVDRLALQHTSMRNLRARVQLQDSALAVDLRDADFTEGGLRGHLRVRASDAGAEVGLRLLALSLTPADLRQLEDNGELLRGGATDLYVDLQAEGQSLRQLGGTLTGEVALEISDATIGRELFELFDSEILMTTIGLVNPVVLREDRTYLECAVIYFSAFEGVLTSPNQMVFETEHMEIRAGGSIDLRDESLEVEFIPNEREGIDIDLGNVADLVRLDGSLAEPEVGPDAGGILRGAATVAAAIATGGVSLVAKEVFDQMRDTGTPCGEVFRERVAVPADMERGEDVDDDDNDDDDDDDDEQG